MLSNFFSINSKASNANSSSIVPSSSETAPSFYSRMKEAAKSANQVVNDVLGEAVCLFRPFEGALINAGIPLLSSCTPILTLNMQIGRGLEKYVFKPIFGEFKNRSYQAKTLFSFSTLGLLVGGLLSYDGLRAHFLNQEKVKEALLLNLGSEFFVSGISFVSSAYAIKSGIDLLSSKEKANSVHTSTDMKNEATASNNSTVASKLQTLKGLTFLAAGGIALILGIQRAYNLIQGYQIASQMDLEQVKGVLLGDSLADLPGAKKTNAVFIDGIDETMYLVNHPELTDVIKAFSHRMTKKPVMNILYRNANVRYYEAGSEAKLFEDLKSATTFFKEKIQNLILHGHGSPFRMKLGTMEFSKDSTGLFSKINSFLKKDAHLILNSCLTGYPIPSMPIDIFGINFGSRKILNLGETMSKYMSNISVYANHLPIKSFTTDFWFNNQNKLEMNAPIGWWNNFVYEYLGTGTSILKNGQLVSS